MKYFNFKLVRAHNTALGKLQQAQADLIKQVLPDYLRAERQRDKKAMNKILDGLPKSLQIQINFRDESLYLAHCKKQPLQRGKGE